MVSGIIPSGTGAPVLTLTQYPLVKRIEVGWNFAHRQGKKLFASSVNVLSNFL